MNMKILLDHNPLAPSNAAPTDFGAMFRTRPAWKQLTYLALSLAVAPVSRDARSPAMAKATITALQARRFFFAIMH